MNDDFQLLRCYATRGNEAAFTELVRRHADLVYAAALRRLNGRAELAEDVSQEVFVDLARKAGTLPPNIALGGWLHRHTGFVAGNALRAEARRLKREQTAHSMNDNYASGPTLLERLSAELDAALDQLAGPDRDALALRFLERCDLRTVGARLGLSDDAAQKRVSRALDKLRTVLARRGHAVPAVALATVLTQAAAVTAPAAFATRVAGAVATMAGTAGAGSAAVAGGKSLIPFLLMNKFKAALVVVLAAGVTVPIVVQHRQITRLTKARQELESRLEQSRRERDDLSTASQRLQVAVTQARADTAELTRLRGDIARLRRDLTAITNQTTRFPASRASGTAAPDGSQTNLIAFTGAARASLAPGQTLVVGGWPIQPGKRTLALFTPDAAGPGQPGSILINGIFLQVPEAVLSGPGWEQFQAVTRDASSSGVFDAEQARKFIETLEKMEGVDVLSSPRLTTSSGTAGNIFIGESTGAGFTTTLLPTVAADGRSVDLTVSNSLRRLP